ncbi:hypothetical protein [Vibrio sagamiensis]|nr:hypothetical protein [Vibrio sagamiensis]
MNCIFLNTKGFDRNLTDWNAQRVVNHNDFAKGSGLSQDSLRTFFQ